MNTTNASTNMTVARRPLAAPIPSQSPFSVIYPPGGCAGIRTVSITARRARAGPRKEERRFGIGALAGAPGACLLLLQLSGRVDRQNPHGVGGGEPGVLQRGCCVACGCLVVEDREDQRPVCQCLNLPSGRDSMCRQPTVGAGHSRRMT